MDTKKLRQKILDLAIHGKLVPQDPNDEPASVLLERIRAEKERLVKEGKIKKSKKTDKSSDTPHYEQSKCFTFLLFGGRTEEAENFELIVFTTLPVDSRIRTELLIYFYLPLRSSVV